MTERNRRRADFLEAQRQYERDREHPDLRESTYRRTATYRRARRRTILKPVTWVGLLLFCLGCWALVAKYVLA